MSSLPAQAGTLAIDFMDDYLLEKSVHCTDEYVSLLKGLRSSVESNSVCCFCGFPDHFFLEVHHVDGDHDNHHHENLRYICTLCHRLQHLGWVGVANLGKIIYLPELKDHNLHQTRFWLEPLNHIQRFYLMQDALSFDEKARLKQMPLTANVVDILGKLKTQDIDINYDDQKVLRADFLQDLKKIEQADKDSKPAILAEVKKDRLERQRKIDDKQAGSTLTDLHILDLLSILIDSDTKASFLSQQNEGKTGRMSIWFNTSVFEPFEPNPDYTLEDRLNYYREMGYFSAAGLQQVMQTLRTQAMDN